MLEGSSAVAAARNDRMVRNVIARGGGIRRMTASWRVGLLSICGAGDRESRSRWLVSSAGATGQRRQGKAMLPPQPFRFATVNAGSVECVTRVKYTAPLWVARIGGARLALWTITVGVVVLGLMGPSSTIARTAKTGPVIACFHGKIRRFTAQAHPSRCVIAGYRGKKFVRVPVKGVNWGHWGAKRTFGAYGVDKRDGRGVRLVAFHPIHCDEGRVWYSKVDVVYPGPGTVFELRLPTCKVFSMVG